jgi:hypothetical protein
MIKQAPKDRPSPHQGIVLDERGQEQSADKVRAQHVSPKKPRRRSTLAEIERQ